jgi:NAD+ diphosphatase
MPPRLGGKHERGHHATQESAQVATTERTSMIDLADAFDSSAHERTDEGLIDRLRQDPATRVLQISGDSAPVADGAVAFSAPSETAEDAVWAFLGRARSGEGLLLAVFEGEAPDPVHGEWTSYRTVGAALEGFEASLFTAGLALGRWRVDSPFCPRCGAATDITMAGWARRCTSCRREHFPRTDPAVIVAITNQDRSKLLLGANAAWKGEMFSCFAGFVEAGESAELTAHRELLEETGVRIDELTYITSQAWPFPRSLMLGFHATVVDESSAKPDGEEIIASRWFTRDEIGRGLDGELDVRLPGGASVAYHLIRTWYDET